MDGGDLQHGHENASLWARRGPLGYIPYSIGRSECGKDKVALKLPRSGVKVIKAEMI